MTSKIVEYERPLRFVDEMQSGPFAAFRHEHHFEEREGRTLMRDVVEYRLPLWVLGRLVDRMILRRYLRALLKERNRHVREAAEAAAS